jgi:hypothetical protein
LMAAGTAPEQGTKLFPWTNKTIVITKNCVQIGQVTNHIHVMKIYAVLYNS